MLVSSVKSSDGQGFTPRTSFASASSNYDFRGQELRKDIETLKQQFDHWILSKKNQVISERDSYTNILADHAVQVEQSKKIYHQLTQERDILMATLEKEKKEMMERESDLKTLKEQHLKMESLKRELEKKHIDLQNKVKREQEIHEQKERIKTSMLQKDQPELAFFRKIFALDIEALRKDLMKFIFTNVDCDDWSREFVIIIDVSSANYRVTSCEPSIDGLEELIAELNDDRDFYSFLKKIRRNFVEHIKQEQISRSR